MNLDGEIRSNPETGNAWKVIETKESTVVAECTQGPDKGDVEEFSRVSFLEGMLDPEEFQF
jgi:hypothetical protein